MTRALPVMTLLALPFLQPPPPGGSWSRILTVYRDRLQQAGIVGSGLMLVRDGAVAGKAFEGYQDEAATRQIDEDTIFHWASITKMFTGVAILQLRDRGLLALDDPAIKYVPELRESTGTCPKSRFATSCRTPRVSGPRPGRGEGTLQAMRRGNRRPEEPVSR